MNIHIDRITRYIQKDMFLPFYCYVSKKEILSPYNYCNCVIDCKYLQAHRVSKPIQDYWSYLLAKDRKLYEK